MSSAASAMDRMYRRQRHIYDASRKFYLLGRDRVIDALAPPAGGSVLEIGKPDAAVYGPTLALLGDVARHRIVAVGDTPHTDLAGAMAAGLDGLWAMTGLFQHAHGDNPAPEEISRLAEAEHVRPVAALRGLRI